SALQPDAHDERGHRARRHRDREPGDQTGDERRHARTLGLRGLLLLVIRTLLELRLRQPHPDGIAVRGAVFELARLDQHLASEDPARRDHESGDDTRRIVAHERLDRPGVLAVARPHGRAYLEWHAPDRSTKRAAPEDPGCASAGPGFRAPLRTP